MRKEGQGGGLTHRHKIRTFKTEVVEAMLPVAMHRGGVKDVSKGGATGTREPGRNEEK